MAFLMVQVHLYHISITSLSHLYHILYVMALMQTLIVFQPLDVPRSHFFERKSYPHTFYLLHLTRPHFCVFTFCFFIFLSFLQKM